MEEITIGVVTNTRDLGVIVDEDLSFSKHIHDKVNVAFKMLGIINRNFKHLNEQCFLLLYKCLVRSQLEFCSSVWNPYKVSFIFDLEKVQKRATKMITSLKKKSYLERLKLLHLPCLRFRRLRGDMIEVYKILNNVYDFKVSQILERNLDDRTRGHSKKLTVQRSNLDIRKFSFCVRVVNVWNSLPESVVSASSVNSFKNSLDSLWCNKDFYYDFKANMPYAMY